MMIFSTSQYKKEKILKQKNVCIDYEACADYGIQNTNNKHLRKNPQAI